MLAVAGLVAVFAQFVIIGVGWQYETFFFVSSVVVQPDVGDVLEG
jgi:hypothetical protein